MDHTILYSKLYCFGFHALPSSLIFSNLRVSVSSVKIGEYLSSSVHISTGVPEASILGPRISFTITPMLMMFRTLVFAPFDSSDRCQPKADHRLD